MEHLYGPYSLFAYITRIALRNAFMPFNTLCSVIMDLARCITVWAAKWGGACLFDRSVQPWKATLFRIRNNIKQKCNSIIKSANGSILILLCMGRFAIMYMGKSCNYR